MPGKTNTLLIKTPEGIVFSQLLASPVSRFMAWIIDLAAISAAMTVLGFVLNVLQVLSADIAGALLALAYFVLSIGYGITLEWLWRGQTIGKRVLRLRVVDAEGMRLQFHQVVIRNLLRFVDSLPVFYFVGGVACVLNKKTQRLGDFAANTVVIRNPRISEPDLDQLLTGKFNSLRQYPHLEARLRQRVTPMEASLVIQALLRRDEFDPKARIELLGEIAAHFREKSGFPPEATDGITDEQFIRNIADVLFRTRRGKKLEKETA
ncbi:RDD family protein [Pedosphaera parvula]|uniref:RDD domain containing protein n=1 Tax=Pedosphaera parvula (strain Ellin514) TaxID=320771 RepID=B9XGD7_PEDPL|nr:RDD family protein [Pedosphaera parvula]EEF60988.1 RDD domain containing protein [Pedosphaera parvula Ellin514]